MRVITRRLIFGSALFHAYLCISSGPDKSERNDNFKSTRSYPATMNRETFTIFIVFAVFIAAFVYWLVGVEHVGTDYCEMNWRMPDCDPVEYEKILTAIGVVGVSATIAVGVYSARKD
jgi:hypothetical protein